MKKVSSFVFKLLFTLLSFEASAQFGIQGSYANIDAPNWEERIGASFNPAFGVGMDYSFRLKNLRIEFFPQIFALISGQPSFYQEPGLVDSYVYIQPDFLQFGFKGIARIYPFDMEGDCNCPTFSKRGNFLKKGFFFQAYPAVSILSIRETYGLTASTTKPDQTQTTSDRAFSWGGGFGAGVDIGFSDRFTFTPSIAYEYYTGTDMTLAHCSLCLLVPVRSELRNLSFGLRMGFHLED